MAKFFKSDWFKCVAVLLVLAVVLGGLLAVLSDVLFVSPTERANRAIKKIYGSEMQYTAELDIDGENKDNPLYYYQPNDNTKKIGQINKVYKIANGDILFQSVGYDGYKGGTITLWVKVIVGDDNKYAIDKVVLESYDKQTLMSKLDGTYYGGFRLTDVTKAYNENKFFTTDSEGGINNPVSGATYSANAGNNAVNCVIQYVGKIGG